MPHIAVISVAHIHSRDFCKRISEQTSGGAPHVIWDENPERGRLYAADFNCPFEPDLAAVLADPAIDAFVICAENTRHLPLLRQVLPLGKPTLCEKPLATTAEEAAEAVALARKAGTALTFGYFQPFSGSNRAVRQLLADQALGRVTHVNFRNAHHAAYGRWFDNPDLAWFTDPALSGGGALLDMGTHAVHLLRHLGGPVTAVWAMTANFAGNYPDVDDYGVIQMKFASGAMGRAEAGWVFTGGHQGLEVIGSEKSIWHADGLRLGGPGTPAEAITPLDDKPTRIDRLIAITKGELTQAEIDEDIDAAYDAVRIMAAAYTAAQTGQWQTLNPEP